MVELKTKQTDQSVEQFLNSVQDVKRRQDCFTILEMMKKVTGFEPKMWGTSMIGFGNYHYKYASGHEGDMFLAGFSPRKQELTLYIGGGLQRYEGVMKNLGKYRAGKGCLYIKKVEDIDLPVLEELVKQSVAHQLKTSIDH